jgi:N-acetylglucosamine repressor
MLEHIFWQVFYRRETSRAGLAEDLGVSLPTVSRTVHRLLEQRLLVEAGATLSARGRHPGVLRVNPDLAFLLGLEIDRDRVAAAVTDLGGNPLGYASASCDARQSFQATMLSCRQAASTALEAAGLALEKIGRVGVGHTGTLDLETGMCLSWDGAPQWRQVALRASLQSLFSRPVTLDDRARALALAQHWSAPEHWRHRNILYVHVGTGIGAGIFMEGALVRGATKGAGEIGHLVIDPDGPVCRCGNRGCVEAFASTEAVLRQAREAVRTGSSAALSALALGRPEAVDLEMLLTAARRQDPAANQLLSRAAAALGTGIANAIQVLNPSLVVLCGRFAHLARELVLEPVCDAVRRLCLKNVAKQLEIRLGAYRPDLGAVGCALLAAEQEARALLRRNPTR